MGSGGKVGGDRKPPRLNVESGKVNPAGYQIGLTCYRPGNYPRPAIRMVEETANAVMWRSLPAGQSKRTLGASGMEKASEI